MENIQGQCTPHNTYLKPQPTCTDHITHITLKEKSCPNLEAANPFVRTSDLCKALEKLGHGNTLSSI